MDVKFILDKLDSLGLVKLGKVSGDYVTCHCPFHNQGNERRPSCGVLTVDQWRNGNKYPAGWWHCFSCGYTNTMIPALTEILHAHNINQTGQEWLIINVPGYEENPDFESLLPDELVDEVTGKFALDYIRNKQEEPQQKYVSEEELASYRFIVPYMYERHLTDEVIEAFDIGYDANWRPFGKKNPVPCITIPIRDKEGRTLFFCRRSIQGKIYNYPQGVIKPLFGIDMVPPKCKSLVICESAINALTCWTFGYPAVALLGTGNRYQIQQLKELGVPEYVLCMDGDEAGIKATARLKKQLSSVAIVWTINMYSGKDVNDITKQEFDKLYSERT